MEVPELQIQYVSDLHFELSSSEKSVKKMNPPILADILIVAGDICSALLIIWEKFLKKMSLNYKHVIIVPGNHEYYNVRLSSSYSSESTTKESFLAIEKEMMGALSQYTNVHLLINSSIVINGWKFVGTTLWSDIPEKEKVFAMATLNDYDCIYSDSGTKIVADDTILWHKKACQFIAKELASTPSQPIIVITHHCPLPGKRIGYCTDLRELMTSSNLVAWIYGHTHIRSNITLSNGVQLLNHPYIGRGTFGKATLNFFI
jgi:Icc-related predicted phosphoesterase